MRRRRRSRRRERCAAPPHRVARRGRRGREDGGRLRRASSPSSSSCARAPAVRPVVARVRTMVVRCVTASATHRAARLRSACGRRGPFSAARPSKIDVDSWRCSSRVSALVARLQPGPSKHSSKLSQRDARTHRRTSHTSFDALTPPPYPSSASSPPPSRGRPPSARAQTCRSPPPSSPRRRAAS